jgi:hypothetical protein
VNTNWTRARRLAWALLTGTSALLILVGLSLVLSRSRVSAQPAAEGATLTAQEPPFSQIRSPDMDAIITQKGSLTVSGIAWDPSIEPPYLTDYPTLSVQQVSEWSYFVSWTGVTSATHYILQEASRPDFSDQTPESVEAPTTSFLVTKGTAEDGTYYYRVRATRLDLEPSRWSNVESVVVPWAAVSTDLSVPALSADVAANDFITVEVRADRVGGGDDGDWHTAVVTATDWGGAEWSYEWPLPEENDVQYTIQSRARDASGIPGAIDTITVTLRNERYIVYLPRIYKRWPPIPLPPILDDIDNPGDDPDYTVTWSYPYSDPPVTSYTLQEATDANFTDPTDYDVGNRTSYAFTDKDGATYYYRVRGNNSWGPGEWSEVKSVTVFNYFDNFSDYKSGWPREWSETRGALYQVRPYEHPKCPGSNCPYDDGDGYVIARRSGSNPAARFGPGVAVPSENYEIELKSRWWDANYYATYQIFFGSDSSFSNYYAVEVRINTAGDRRDCEYRLVRHTVSQTGNASIESTKKLQDWTSVDMHCGLRSEKSGTPWNRWRIRREGDEIRIWLNEAKLSTWHDSMFGADRYFGVGCTLFEGFTPSKPEFDNWSVVLLQ